MFPTELQTTKTDHWPLAGPHPLVSAAQDLDPTPTPHPEPAPAPDKLECHQRLTSVTVTHRCQCARRVSFPECCGLLRPMEHSERQLWEWTPQGYAVGTYGWLGCRPDERRTRLPVLGFLATLGDTRCSSSSRCRTTASPCQYAPSAKQELRRSSKDTHTLETYIGSLLVGLPGC